MLSCPQHCDTVACRASSVHCRCVQGSFALEAGTSYAVKFTSGKASHVAFQLYYDDAPAAVSAATAGVGEGDVSVTLPASAAAGGAGSE